MKGRILSIAVFVLALFSLPAFSTDADVETIKYAEITDSRVSVLAQVDDNAALVAIVNRGSVHEIVTEGDLWMEIETPEGRGWIPFTKCRILDHKPVSILSNTGHTFAFIAVIVLGLTVILVFLMRRKEDEDIF